MNRVAVEACPDYGLDTVRRAVGESIGRLGGIQAFVSPGDRVLLKPNLLLRRKPEKATTTHPAVVQAVAELVVSAGGTPVIFDSPGGYAAHTQTALEGLYETCGMRRAAEQSGAALCLDETVVEMPNPQGRTLKSIETVRSVTAADKIINLPKLKTHMMMTMSGAVKNLFGIVPGLRKAEYHFRFEDEDDFASAIVDICLFAKPVLNVMDAVVAMEGQGPTNGRPKHVGLILASADPCAMDVAAAGVIGLDPRKAPTIRECARRGLCTGRPEDVEILGVRLRDAAVRCAMPPTMVAFNIYDWLLPRPVARRLNRAMKFKPVFRAADCRGCGVCVKSCPAKAIEMKNGKPALDAGACISCFCCHELCDFDAVDIRKPWFLKALIR